MQSSWQYRYAVLYWHSFSQKNDLLDLGAKIIFRWKLKIRTKYDKTYNTWKAVWLGSEAKRFERSENNQRKRMSGTGTYRCTVPT
jgi:hypothetical protein